MADAGGGAASRRRPPLIDVTDDQRKAVHKMIDRWKLAGALGKATDKVAAIQPISERLAVYLPEPILTPYERKPLFVACIQEGLARFNAGEGTLDDWLLGVMAKAHLILRYDLVGFSGRWDPIHGEPLAAWLAENSRTKPGDKMVAPWPPVSINTFATSLFERLVPEGECTIPASIQEFTGP